MVMAKQQIGPINQSKGTEARENKKKYSYSHIHFVKTVTNVHGKEDSQFNGWWWQTDVHVQENDIRTMFGDVEKSFPEATKTLV